MGLSVNEFNHTLNSLFGEKKQFKLLKVSEWRDFDGDDRDIDRRLLGYKYLVADLDMIIKFHIKIEGDTPIITNEEVQSTEVPISVCCPDSIVKFHGPSLFNCDISVTAKKIVLTKQGA